MSLKLKIFLKNGGVKYKSESIRVKNVILENKII